MTNNIIILKNSRKTHNISNNKILVSKKFYILSNFKCVSRKKKKEIKKVSNDIVYNFLSNM